MLILLPAANRCCELFGASYASQATVAVQILALGVFPEAIRTHFVAVRRLNRRIGAALPLVWGGAYSRSPAAPIGGLMTDSLTGVAIGWLIAICIESSVMSRDVWRMVAPGGGVKGRGPTRSTARRGGSAHRLALQDPEAGALFAGLLAVCHGRTETL